MTLRPIEYIELETALRVCEKMGWQVARPHDLASAVERPAASVFGGDAYPTLPLKAAATVHSVACNHALVDGNKRLAWTLLILFLELNLHTTELTEDEGFDLIMGIASGELRDVDEIADGLKVVPKEDNLLAHLAPSAAAPATGSALGIPRYRPPRS